ncbi:diaminopimelate decarboxylase [Corynebacterium bovis]|uniref:Diaminopimelate decarboxylase n=1 Tax=Corynebacterium bovis DSM 20582 = CIP 54.80 TaxID=927655 RepID=A0A8H9YAL3_9CORY|nr:diaminopimelate decarboxylase [Corynebacterium bovis]MBB3116378.1 diaminopimelate decarboxylase [Corynebacterium bovis DSM 20582 = CIP 54.80]QQC47536.1 diaminopimelate decarboxylase [Corynebacterium bovis]RRO82509.1 diaminopimelate decarboxylase [Corynebacterium bovis]RRO83884.1 diaminopimelate decarboxylase [Corynebacterium bovis]RRO85115.1 diaminopimelate decarboxylase [Corynebacterium bovis]
MDPQVSLPVTPLRRRVSTLDEFTALPEHVFPLTTTVDSAGRAALGGVLFTDIAERVGTPVFVMDEEDFRARCRRLAAAFRGGHHVHYASKAFLSRTVCRWVEEEGLALDVASEGELAVALSAAFPAGRITVHGNNKSERFLRMAVEAGAGLIVLDSSQEIGRLAEVAAAAGRVQDVLVRVKPGVHVDTHEFIATSHEDQKFGFSLASGSAERAALAVAGTGSLRLRGLHCHVGSQVFDADGFALAAERLLGLWSRLLGSFGADGSGAGGDAGAFDILDLGGGYGIAYTPDQSPLDVEAVAGDLLAQVERHATEIGVPVPSVSVEPGRAVVGPTTVTLYRVGTVKDVHTSDDAVRRYLSVDGGMSDNIRPALYRAEYDCRLVNRVAEGRMVPTRVVGSHCESGDIIINDALMPDDIAPGDLLAVPATGAYCYSMSSRYNMMTRPPVVVVRDGELRTMLRRETLDDVLSLEVDGTV